MTESVRKLREGQRRSPTGEPMHRIPADDEHRGMGEGLCMSCMGVTAEWRAEDGGWQECDDCADIDGEEPLNEAKRALAKAKAGLRKPDLTPMARMVMERIVANRERIVAAMRERYDA